MKGLALILLIGLALAYVWIVIFTMHRLRHPRRRTYASALAQNTPGDPSELPTPLNFERWSIAFHPKPGVTLDLPVWEITGANPDGPLVLMSPGWGDSKIGALARVDALAPLCSRIFAIDTPGLGEAEGACGLGVLEPAALRALVERAAPPPEGSLGVILLGWSLGAGAAIQAAAELAEDARLIGVIAESPSRLTITPARNVMRAARLPYRVNLPIAYALIGWRLGVGPSWRGFDRAMLAAQVRVPLLVIHGQEDHVCPFEDGCAIADDAPLGELVAIETAAHNDLWTDPRHRPVCKQAVMDFISRCAELRTATDTPAASDESAHH